MENEHPGEWLPLQQAAIRLHLSPDNVRKKAQRGQLIARQVPRPQGHTWEIYLGENQVVDQETQVGTGSDLGALTMAVLELTRENSRLSQENAELASQVTEKGEAASLWQGRAEILGGELDRARNRILLLEAPKTNGVTHPWWQFWKRGSN